VNMSVSRGNERDYPDRTETGGQEGDGRDKEDKTQISQVSNASLNRVLIQS
jgi:hypothetical protein